MTNRKIYIRTIEVALDISYEKAEKIYDKMLTIYFSMNKLELQFDDLFNANIELFKIIK